MNDRSKIKVDCQRLKKKKNQNIQDVKIGSFLLNHDKTVCKVYINQDQKLSNVF